MKNMMNLTMVAEDKKERKVQAWIALIFVVLQIWLLGYVIAKSSNTTDTAEDPKTTATDTMDSSTDTTTPKTYEKTYLEYRTQDEAWKNALMAEFEIQEPLEWYSEEEMSLARLIEGENGILPIRTRIRTAIVIVNRRNSDVFEETTIDSLMQVESQFEAYEQGLVPDVPDDRENLEIAHMVLEVANKSAEEWERFCEKHLLTARTTFYADESVDQTEYSTAVLIENGRVGSWEYVTIYGESNYELTETKCKNVNVFG